MISHKGFTFFPDSTVSGWMTLHLMGLDPASGGRLCHLKEHLATALLCTRVGFHYSHHLHVASCSHMGHIIAPWLTTQVTENF